MKSMKDILELVEKIGYLKTLILLIVILASSFFLGGRFGPKWELSQIFNVFNSGSGPGYNMLEAPNQSIPSTTSTPTISSSENLPEKEFENFISEWVIKNYKRVADGFLCAQKNDEFPAPEIWYKNPLPVYFTSLKFSYRIDKKSKKPVPPFIISIGDGLDRIARFSTHELNPQLVGFDYYIVEDSELKLKRERPASELSEPVETNAPIYISIRSIPLQENKIQMILNISYISALTGNQVENTFKFDIKILNPDPSNLKIKMGVGTTIGNCFRFISYKFIP